MRQNSSCGQPHTNKLSARMIRCPSGVLIQGGRYLRFVHTVVENAPLESATCRLKIAP
jgi:hypothetical protein